MFLLAWLAACIGIYCFFFVSQAWELRRQLRFPRHAAKLRLIDPGVAIPDEVAAGIAQFEEMAAQARFSVPTVLEGDQPAPRTIVALTFSDDLSTVATLSWSYGRSGTAPKPLARKLTFATLLTDGRRVCTGHPSEAHVLRPSRRIVGCALPADLPLARLPALHDAHLSSVANPAARARLRGVDDPAAFLASETNDAMREQIEMGAYRLGDDGQHCRATLRTACHYLLHATAPSGPLLQTLQRRRERRNLRRLQQLTGAWRELAQPTARATPVDP